MPPVIGITCSSSNDEERLYINQPYIRAICEADGIPVILPPVDRHEVVESYLALCNGFLLSGGGDVDPFLFQEEPHPSLGLITPERDLFELELARNVMAAGKPVLGICRGIQLLNIAAGGDIYQDINSQLKPEIKHYQQAPRWYPTHSVSLIPGTRIARAFSDSVVRVNSFHHQSVRSVASGFRISGTSAEGLVEAIEREGEQFVVGVQWHPECMWEKDRRVLGLFRALVDASQR